MKLINEAGSEAIPCRSHGFDFWPLLIYGSILLIGSSFFPATAAFSQLPIHSSVQASDVVSAKPARSLPIYDVRVSIRPESQTSGTESNVNYTIRSRNVGTSPFNATGYILMVEPPQTAMYSSYSYDLTGSILFSPDSRTFSIINLKVGPSSQEGQYNFIFYWTGTVNGVSMRAHSCNFTLIID